MNVSELDEVPGLDHAIEEAIEGLLALIVPLMKEVPEKQKFDVKNAIILRQRRLSEETSPERIACRIIREARVRAGYARRGPSHR